jgi:hypothetical protein
MRNGVCVNDFGVLLGRHGSNKQGVYTVVWKNWSTDMFGTSDFQQEAVLNPIVVGRPSMVTGSTKMIPEQPISSWPFVYTKEYYNNTSIVFKTEDHLEDSDSETFLKTLSK